MSKIDAAENLDKANDLLRHVVHDLQDEQDLDRDRIWLGFMLNGVSESGRLLREISSRLEGEPRRD